MQYSMDGHTNRSQICGDNINFCWSKVVWFQVNTGLGNGLATKSHTALNLTETIFEISQIEHGKGKQYVHPMK